MNATQHEEHSAGDWRSVPVFGEPPRDATPVVRPSAYGVLRDARGLVAVVRSSDGVYLPGGGHEPGETPREAIVRESLEECGLVVVLGDRELRAIQHAYSEEEATHYEKRSTFIAGAPERIVGGCEEDHRLEWVDPAEACRILTPGSHRWAVDCCR